MFTGRAWRLPALVICLAAIGWLASGFLVGVQTDDEEYRHTIPSTMVAAEAMQRGELAFWTSRLGIGTPQPFGQSLSAHPLTLLLGIIPVVRWVQLFYVVHLLIAAGGMWLLARRVGASMPASAMAVATYALASPALNYALRDFWPSTWPVYTLAPLLAVAMLALTDAATRRARLSASLGLGVVAGIIGSNGHQGYLVVYIPACIAFLLPHLRVIVRHWGWWLLAAAIAAVVAAPITYHLATELGMAPQMLDARFYTQTLTFDSLWDIFLRPLGRSPDGWELTTFRRGVRGMAFGGAAAMLAIVYVVAVRKRLDFLLGMLVPLIVLSVPGLLISKYFSAIYLFRDPVILFAVPCAALALDWIASRPRIRYAAPVLLAAQLVLLAASAWPFINYNLEARAQPRTTELFVGDLPVARWLRDYVAPSSARVYYSAAVDDMLWKGELMPDGLWRNSMFYRGVSVINGGVSFVSIDALTTDSVIRGMAHVTADTTLLDLAGARWVLAAAHEAVSPALVRRAEIASQRGAQLVLYELPSARGAAFVEPAVRSTTLPIVDGCPHDRLFCRDFSRLAPLLSPAPVRVDRANGRVTITFEPSTDRRLLLVGEMFRPGWRAAEDGVATEPLLGALVGVSVPAGTDRVTLRFRPPVRVGLARAAWSTLALATLGWAITFFGGARSEADVPA